MVYKTAPDSLVDYLTAGYQPERGKVRGASLEHSGSESRTGAPVGSPGRQGRKQGPAYQGQRANQCYLSRPCLARH
jgi:hypothetical protein